MPSFGLSCVDTVHTSLNSVRYCVTLVCSVLVIVVVTFVGATVTVDVIVFVELAEGGLGVPNRDTQIEDTAELPLSFVTTDCTLSHAA